MNSLNSNTSTGIIGFVLIWLAVNFYCINQGPSLESIETSTPSLK